MRSPVMSSVAPPGRSCVSSCHCMTRSSGSRNDRSASSFASGVSRTGSNPTSLTGRFTTSVPSARARICDPRQIPRYGTPRSIESRVYCRTAPRCGYSSTWSTFTVPPNVTTPPTSSSGGSWRDGWVMFAVTRSMPARANAPGATPNVSNPSLRTSRTGFTEQRYRREPSAALEVSGQLPIRDGRVVEDDLLLNGCVQQVLVHERAERLLRDMAVAEGLDRLVQRERHARHVLRLVRVAVEHRRWLGLVLDAPQAGGDRRREREVRVRVGSRDPGLH